MLLHALIAVPAIAGAVAFVLRNDSLRRSLLLSTAIGHAGLTLAAWRCCLPVSTRSDLLGLDELSLVFLSLTSVLFLAGGIYGIGYLARERRVRGRREEDGFIFNNAPEAIFTGCLLLFLSAMTLVNVSRHFGLLWVAVEATTLVSAPLIYFHRHSRSLEAVWKYLMICSVGIALALLGNFFLAVAAKCSSDAEASLSLPSLLAQASALDPKWLKASFILLFVGYGVKMGLAPMHAWLPDAHSEAPSMVSALLSGSLLNCALLAILRAQQVCVAAGLQRFGQDLFLLFGLLSIALATVFIIGQSDYKRLLAYSSVENMGIISLGVGIGGAGVFGGLLHAMNHSLIKAALFLLAGNMIEAYATKSIKQIAGAFILIPRTAFLWLIGFFAIVGSPPFGTFLSKFRIIEASVAQGHFPSAIMFALLAAVVFAGMSALFLRMVFGRHEDIVSAPASSKGGLLPTGERVLAWLPPALLLAPSVLLGIHIPATILRVVEAAAQCFRGAP
jgi:hydrogenase-4 component F